MLGNISDPVRVAMPPRGPKKSAGAGPGVKKKIGKKKKAEAAQQGAESANASASSPPTVADVVKDSFNAEYFMKIRTMKREIMAMEVFADVCGCPPLALDAALNPDMTGRQGLATITLCHPPALPSHVLLDFPFCALRHTDPHYTLHHCDSRQERICLTLLS